ncbi:glycosyltransferase [Pendulispora albinea]|uniref:Glycosyltransferase n=1 Tax=Pendulispora albinea TaxID=2741071 RepID=A0ABZ2LUK5_9BACT
MTSYTFVFLGLSITSSWGNGHATTYRGLLRELAARGHQVVFLERDLPFYADNRDLPSPSFARTYLYGSLDELRERYADMVRDADLVVVGSYVPEGIDVGAWVQATARGCTAFYDIDTPVTLRQIERGRCEYLSRELISSYDLYLSFTGGPTLGFLERDYGARCARPLYCSFDPELYYPEHPERDAELRWDLGYLGTYSDDRHPTMENLLFKSARAWPEGRYIVAGPQYPSTIAWPWNVERVEHLSPQEHRAFYGSQRYTLNITRRDMIDAGYSPSVRLFEAAACETPVLSDRWSGIETFFKPGWEIALVETPSQILQYLRDVKEPARLAMAKRARKRALAEHTAAHRAESLERYTAEVLALRAARERKPAARRARISC